ncbi:MAG: glycosyltransferase [Paramuribaculum sp.]|nr:glycosyltransferase [Paramuribaculum sp.]
MSKTKPRILLVNKFYKRDGGDCIHFLALEKLLRDNGCDVAVLAMSHPRNIPLPSGSFEVPCVSIDGTLPQKVKAASRILGGAGIRCAVRDALKSFCPDVVHLHNVHSYLSPAVAEEAHKAGIPVVWTLHDYKLICGSYSCLRGGMPCDDCLNDSTSILRNKCMKQSLAASVLAYMESKKWSRRKLQEITDRFICPSIFMRDRMADGGLASGSLEVIHNFLPIQPEVSEKNKRSGVCYIGRLSIEKGLEYLLEAAVLGGWQLNIAGSGSLEEELKSRFEKYPNIRFLGMLDAAGVSRVFNNSLLSVIPSVCYENNPLSAIESLSLGTPVAASAIGGLPELINESNGVLFSPRNPEAINDAVNKMIEKKYDYEGIADAARHKFSSGEYFSRLMSVYGSVIDSAESFPDPEN